MNIKTKTPAIILAIAASLLLQSAAQAQTNTFPFPADGNVGIGTTNPEALFEVRDSILPITPGSRLDIARFAAHVVNYDRLELYAHRRPFQAGEDQTNTGSWWTSETILQRVVDITPMGYLKFTKWDVALGVGNNDILFIHHSGNVGIGTAAPNAPIEISSDSSLGAAGSASLLVRGQSNKERIYIQSAGGDPVLRVAKGRGTFDNPLPLEKGDALGFLQLGGFDGLEWARSSWITGNAEENWSLNQRGSSLIFSTTPCGTVTITERMRIGANGNVGIGTTNPTHTLTVSGTIRAKEIIVESNWADYIFADDYQLQSLDTVEQHIKTHKHLPGIPSAQEVSANGVSLGEMQTLLLAKIEELTLHQIELNKRLRALEQENAALKAGQK
jgi:hypothetical protein